METPSKKEILKGLKSCRPLSDPSGAWLKLILIQATLGLALICGVCLLVTPHLLDKLSFTKSILLWLVTIPAFLWLSSLLTLRSHQKKKDILFLRAFSNDENTLTERKLIQASLPPDYRLAGIRAPMIRNSLWLRLVAEPIMALRYLGSSYFELEAADRNWFARLLSTISRSHGILIDLRHVTPLVHDEIKLATLCLDEQNPLYLLVDSKQEDEHWLDLVQQASGNATISLKQLRLLHMTDGELGKHSRKIERTPARENFSIRASTLFTNLSATPISINAEGYNFARSLVAPPSWKTSWFETPAALKILASILGFSSLFLVAISPWFFIPPLLLGLIAFYLLMPIALSRVVQAAKLRKRFRHSSKPSLTSARIGRFSNLVFLSIPFIAVLLGLGVPIVSKSKKAASMIEAINNAKSLFYALDSFSSGYDGSPSLRQADAIASNSWAMKKDESSNFYLAQLLQTSSVDDETVFYAPTGRSSDKEPDNLYSDAETCLEKGECGFTYVLGAMAGRDIGLSALLCSPMTGEGTKFDPEVYGGRAVVLFTDGSARTLFLNEEGEALLPEDSGFPPGSTLFQDVPGSLWSIVPFDPSALKFPR